MRQLAIGATATMLATMTAHTASAHIVGARLGDFYAGVLHPMTDPLDVVLWTALGVLAGSSGAARARWLILTFPLGLLAGQALGLQSGATSAGPVADAGLTITLGFLLAAATTLPAWCLGGLGLCIALVRGVVNAGGAEPQTNHLLFAAGLAMAGYTVLTLAMAATLAFCTPLSSQPAGWRAIAIRAVGSWIAAIGLMMGGFAFTV